MKIFPLEFSSFEILFKNKKLIIPYYQRDYIWKKDNWEKWLKDIQKLIDCEDVEEIHFIGSIIYKKNPETNPSFPEYLIIDGQQRITTFFVFCLAILEVLKRNNSKNSFLIENINQLLFISDSREPQPRLTMRGEDEKTLRTILSHRNLEDNKERISEAYEYFKKELGGSSMTGIHLKDYFEKIKSKFNFISIKLEKDDDALEIFKSINTSGVMLTSTDLIKAEFFIIYEEKGLDCRKLAQEWEDMKKSVGKENISHFFYVFLLAKYGQKNEYSEKEFYSYFRNKLFQEKENIEGLWGEIIQKSKIYSQILNPQQDYWGENFYLPILEIKILEITRLYPLIVLLKEKELRGKKEATVLKKLIIYSFRIKTKRKTFQQSEVSRWAKLVQNGQLEFILNDPNIIKEIEKSSIFWDELKEKQNLKDNEKKWLLTKFYLTFLPEGFFLSPLQLEHMFPKKPDKEWWLIPEWKNLKEDEKQIKEKLHSLGNSALLTPNQNIAMGNKLWKSKREEFKKKTCLQHEKNELNLLEKSILLPKDIDDRKKLLIQQFKKTGILFIDEEKEKPQIRVDYED